MNFEKALERTQKEIQCLTQACRVLESTTMDHVKLSIWRKCLADLVVLARCELKLKRLIKILPSELQFCPAEHYFTTSL
jgi:hypothetical protein